MSLTIIGLPWPRAAFNIAAYALFPLGQRAVSREFYTGQNDVGTGPLGVIGEAIVQPDMRSAAEPSSGSAKLG